MDSHRSQRRVPFLGAPPVPRVLPLRNTADLPPSRLFLKLDQHVKDRNRHEPESAEVLGAEHASHGAGGRARVSLGRVPIRPVNLRSASVRSFRPDQKLLALPSAVRRHALLLWVCLGRVVPAIHVLVEFLPAPLDGGAAVPSAARSRRQPARRKSYLGRVVVRNKGFWNSEFDRFQRVQRRYALVGGRRCRRIRASRSLPITRRDLSSPVSATGIEHSAARRAGVAANVQFGESVFVLR